MNDLLNIRIRDNMGCRTYKLIGFTVGGDDRSGLYVNSLTIYNEDERLRTTITSPLEMRRYSLVKE